MTPFTFLYFRQKKKPFDEGSKGICALRQTGCIQAPAAPFCPGLNDPSRMAFPYVCGTAAMPYGHESITHRSDIIFCHIRIISYLLPAGNSEQIHDYFYGENTQKTTGSLPPPTRGTRVYRAGEKNRPLPFIDRLPAVHGEWPVLCRPPSGRAPLLSHRYAVLLFLRFLWFWYLFLLQSVRDSR